MQDYVIHQDLKELRESKNITAKQLANMLSLDVTTIYNYESGLRTPKLLTIVRIARIFDISISESVHLFLH